MSQPVITMRYLDMPAGLKMYSRNAGHHDGRCFANISEESVSDQTLSKILSENKKLGSDGELKATQMMVAYATKAFNFWKNQTKGFGKYTPQEMNEFVLSYNYKEARQQLQRHVKVLDLFTQHLQEITPKS